MDKTYLNHLLQFKQAELVRAEENLLNAGCIAFEPGMKIKHRHGKRKGVYQGKIVQVFPNIGILEVKATGVTQLRNVTFREVLEIL